MQCSQVVADLAVSALHQDEGLLGEGCDSAGYYFTTGGLNATHTRCFCTPLSLEGFSNPEILMTPPLHPC